MTEFGERVKQLREKKGITQQTLAEQLYVTRQAVSRWECGARYPDLLTTKRLAVLLGTSMDELVSGEEWKRDIEKEPLLSSVVPNRVQTILYTAAFIAYLLMGIFIVPSLIPGNSAQGIGTEGVPLQVAAAALVYWGNAAVLAFGIYLSAQNRLSPKRVGIIMSAGPLLRLVTFAAVLMEMMRLFPGNVRAAVWGTPLFSIASAVIIYGFFSGTAGRRRKMAVLVYAAAMLRFLGIVISFKEILANYTDLGFIVRTVHSLGEAGLAALLIYQTYILDKKRRRS